MSVTRRKRARHHHCTGVGAGPRSTRGRTSSAIIVVVVVAGQPTGRPAGATKIIEENQIRVRKKRKKKFLTRMCAVFRCHRTLMIIIYRIIRIILYQRIDRYQHPRRHINGYRARYYSIRIFLFFFYRLINAFNRFDYNIMLLKTGRI